MILSKRQKILMAEIMAIEGCDVNIFSDTKELGITITNGINLVNAVFSCGDIIYIDGRRINKSECTCDIINTNLCSKSTIEIPFFVGTREALDNLGIRK